MAFRNLSLAARRSACKRNSSRLLPPGALSLAAMTRLLATMLLLAVLGCDAASSREPVAPPAPPPPPGPPAQIVVISGDNQTGIAGQPLPQPVVVEVRDSVGTPVPGVDVRWGADESAPLGETACGAIRAERAEGMRSIWISTTNSRGITSALWTLPPRRGGVQPKYLHLQCGQPHDYRPHPCRRSPPA